MADERQDPPLSSDAVPPGTTAGARRAGKRFITAFAAGKRAVLAVRSLHQREKNRIRAEISKVPGLMLLLMKRRNDQPWSPDEKRELGVHLRRLSHLSVYLVLLVLPGTTLSLPFIAWWLDRRAQRRIQS